MLDLIYEDGIRIAFRIGCVDTVDVGQENQPIGIYLRCDHGAHPVVVTEYLAYLVRIGNYIILVEDRDHSQGKQCGDTGPQVVVGRPVVEVPSGEKHLGADGIVDSKGLAVVAHQDRVPDCGARLPQWVVGDLLSMSELLGSKPYGP